ncbi:cell wall-binding repeat-containing protein [Mesobacillus sp. AQ2]|uniref:N,N-dimethylformamidase beta subunit family domain-containing protein n=1 Tax=Mesobacillus sp. AQ2 TaxID=3043332 RepID=UPI0024C1F61A|nr:N,N-dimethylformamidase beta subunit family domain-containing protein [Mesobacillus sp. AQ2]WHX40267.1 cell wall-binding repeat-containing protein [Mesobacillus sp. AQ2]
MRMKLLFIILVFFVLGSTKHAAAEGNVSRLSGNDRFDVAIEVAVKGWPGGSEKVYITNYKAFADALAVTPLAYKDNAPVLLTQADILTDKTKKELSRLNPKQAILVGGPASISNSIKTELEKMGIAASRISGKDRFEVASNISRSLGPSDTAIIANGLKFPDALSIAPYAARSGYPILLTGKDRLPDITKKALEGRTKVIVVGGEGSVGPTVFNSLPGRKRISGKDRFEVSANVIKDLNLNTNRFFISTGLTFADALTGSVLAAKQEAPMLLTMPSYVPAPIKKILLPGNAESITVLGGTASVQQSVAGNLYPIENTHSIEGYSNKLSYYPGETIELKIHSPQANFSIDFMRYGKEEKIVSSINNIKGTVQNYFNDAYKEGALWDTAYKFTIPSSWNTGMYAAKVYDGANSFFITFIVKEKTPAFTDIGVLASTNTWQAYNSWGGKSLYSYSIVNGARKYNEFVSFDRPNPGADPSGNIGHLANGEKHIIGWLERNKHSYSMFTERDFNDNPAIIRKFKTIIISTHSEYWSTRMYDGLQNHLKNGGNVLYLSGNGIYWRAALMGDQIEVRKDGGTHSFTGERGGLFYQTGKPETALIGVGYRSTGFSVPAPYKVSNAGHWIFTGTGIKNGDLIGTQGLNKINNSTGGASGWETDQADRYTPKNAIILAKGTNTIGAGAHMVYYDHPGGGGVFSTGSITFGGSLAVDAKLTRIVNNVLGEFK